MEVFLIRTGELLGKLIEIANVPKTDFALSMHMTPSGLSKILSGKRLPVLKEKKLFVRQTANYFAEAIYGDNCFYRFRNLYPILYDFSSRYELEMFLIDAVDDALLQDYAVENNENIDFPDREVSYIGAKSILNHFCITISNHVNANTDADMEFFCSLPLMNRNHQDVFDRIRIINPQNQKNLFCHHYATMAEYEAYIKKNRLKLLTALEKVMQFGDFTLRVMEKPAPMPFLFLRGHFEMNFSVQIDGTPVMTLIHNKLYLFELYNNLMKMKTDRLSYSGKEAVTLLGKNPAMIDEFMKRDIKALYNFFPIGLLLEEADLPKTEMKSDLIEAVSRALVDSITKSRLFYITSDALLTFLITGKIMFPGMGAVDIPSGKRVACIKRYDRFADTDAVNRIRVIRREMPRAAILCVEGASIIYIVSGDGQSENYILFPSNIVADTLAEDINNCKMQIQEYNEELWANYISKISSDALKPCH